MQKYSVLKSLVLASLGLGTALPAIAQGVSGSYLAARHASQFNDYRAAADYYARAMVPSPSRGA